MVKDVLFMMSSSKTVSKQTPPPPQGGRRSKASLQSWKALRRGKKWVPETLPTQWIGKEHTPSLKLFKFLFWKKNLYLFTKIERKKKSLSEAQNIFSKLSFPPKILILVYQKSWKIKRKWKQKIVFISFPMELETKNTSRTRQPLQLQSKRTLHVRKKTPRVLWFMSNWNIYIYISQVQCLIYNSTAITYTQVKYSLIHKPLRRMQLSPNYFDWWPLQKVKSSLFNGQCWYLPR